MRIVRRPMLSSLLSLFAYLAIAVTISIPVSAASTGSGNGMKISPVITNLTVNPGSSQTVTVYVQNLTGAQATLQVLVNDFVASSDESGTPAILLNGQYAPAHSLKRFVAPVNNVVLKPGETKGVPITINVPSTASGGGYYGAIRFMPVGPSGNGNLSLTASVGSLILVKIPGNYKEQLSMLTFNVSHGEKGDPQVLFTSNKGIVANIRFKNTGDVQEQPFGKMILQNGKNTVATYEINNVSPKGNVLPDSVRKFTVSVERVGVFGKYTLVGNFGYGTTGQLLSALTSFYVVPIPAIVAVIIAILIILYLIFILPKQIKWYNKRVVKRALHQ